MMNLVEVKFPGLGIDVNVNPVAFSIGSIEVYWYGLLIASAIVLSVVLAVKQAKKLYFPETLVYDTVLMIIPCAIIGARLYFVACNWDYYGQDLRRIFDFRSGGLAIYGGVILVFIGGLVMCRIRKIPFRELADYCVVYLPLGQAIGRWGNFFNGEAHGGPTDLPWAILVDGEMVHPTFLYESIWCLILFFALSWFDKNKRTAHGQTLSLYLIFYSLERFFVESLRTDSLMIGPFRQAQVISVCAIIFGIILYLWSSKHKPLDAAQDQQ